MMIDKNDPNVMFRAPQGLSISRATLGDNGIRYQRSDGSLERSEILQFETYARSVLNRFDSDEEADLQGPAAVMVKRWQEEIRSLPLRNVSQTVQEKIKADALTRLNNTRRIPLARLDESVVEADTSCVSCC
jgi:hypothetical protein